ncbi:SMP-30/gluconolactonase/LRE family protein [Massilia orientalis]|uniref:SMP-30/gluconolactonase/LRE family protein n=1 Tax=Massilia orientalis TaxID=3050128 RepID=A0ACC7MLY7_9BURK|nr:SMP-30/gluconolactonase/LRE family protein [Massilia sp. YIM B02787]
MMELAVDGRNVLGEGIIWDDKGARLFWTDIESSELWSHAPATGALQRWPLPERLCSMALTHDDGRLLLGLASGLAFFDLASGDLDRICDVEAELPTTRLNDGRTDRQGRFVFGVFNQAENPKNPIGGFYRLNHDLSLERLPLGGVAIANSICFSPDGRTMYYADSGTREIRCCDYDPDTGAVANLREFAAADGAPGDPDGSTIDADGYLWSTRWGAGQVVRFAPDGTVDRVLTLPAPQPTCPAFGGPGLDMLYVTSATVGLRAGQLADAPKSGGVFAKLLTIKGLAEVKFAGRRR